MDRTHAVSVQCVRQGKGAGVKPLRVLIACEYSGTARRAFRARGHDAWSCDLLPAEDGGSHHIQGDVRRELQPGRWDLLIAHPTCTRLTNSGARWLHERNLWAELDQAVEFFRLFLDAPVPRIAVENPIPHGHAQERIGAKYAQIVHPWMFGHRENKATCLWLKNLPPLVETENVRAQMMLLSKAEQNRIHHMRPGPDRWKERSRSYSGIAEAMADQWGAIVQRDLLEAA